MKVASKFLTADVEIVAVDVDFAERKLTVEGFVKGFMPMTVEMGIADMRRMIDVGTRPLRARLAERLPESLAAVVAPKVEESEPAAVASVRA